MELKVWVDNIKRVVCGVTDNTTCQDIVIALAQAMGRTGRFTLIEKWRDNERPLSPNECPLLVLQKWGEFANEVNLILYESGSRRKLKNAEKEVPKTQDRFTHNFTPPVKTSEAVIRRSLTFSGIRKTEPNHYKRPETNQGNMINHLPNNKLLKPAERVTSDGNSWSSNSSLSSQNSAVISQYARTGRPAASSSAQSRVRSSSQDRMHGAPHPQPLSSLHSSQVLNPQHSTHHRPAMPNNAISNQKNSQNHRPYQNNTIDRQRNGMSSDSGPPLRSSAFSPVRPRHSSSDDDREPNVANPDIPVYTEKVKSSQKVVMEEYDLDSNFPDVVKETGREFLIEEYHMPGRQGQGQASGNHSNLVSKEEQERVKLLRLVTMQNERIKMQDSQLDIIDTEISSRVQKIEDSKLQLTQITTEINKLSKVFEEQSQEIVTLDKNGTLIEEIEKEREAEKEIKNEISSLRVRLEKCENDLHQFHTKVKLCSDELEKEQDILKREEKQKQEEEEKVKQEISEVKEELGNIDKHVNEREDKMKDQDRNLEALSKELTDKSERLTAIEKDLQRENLRFFQDPQNKPETKPLGSPEADGEDVFLPYTYHHPPSHTRPQRAVVRRHQSSRSWREVYHPT